MFEFWHVQYHVDGLSKGKEFFGKLFGWKMESAPGMEDYILFETGNADLGGGITGMGKPDTIVYVTVPNVDEWIAKAVELGATVALPASPLPEGMGSVAIIVSPDGNPIGLYSK